MYSSTTHSWRNIAPSKFRYTGGKFLNPEQPVTVNESLYWLNWQTLSSLNVISFDIRHEVFKLLPDSFEKHPGQDYVLMNMRDSVALMCYDWTLFVGNAVDIYIFNEGCSVWSKTCIGPLIGKDPSFLLGQRFITCLRNNDMLFGGPDLKLYCVNPQTHTIKRLESPEKNGDKSIYIYDTCTYSESLISIEGMETLTLYADNDDDFIEELQEHHLESGLIFDCCCYIQIKDQVAF
ncbi:hypothetical protein POM88_031224 [Heracleum sosnowskyi]|uniref:F-box protein n=1 Tax=Heracleum sosnowskyi TaxID=360622 RepID=A0AAD8MIX3_9APIA|nr:hypothetical protein POM88_031224 [Heracleum sosnowskyi]